MEAKVVALDNGEIQIDLDEEMADALINLALENLGENSTEEQQEIFIKQILHEALVLAVEKTLEDENKTN
jgi:hypothetical protein